MIINLINNIYFSPLEQFEILPLFKIFFFFNNSNFNYLLAFFIFNWFFFFSLLNPTIFLRKHQLFIEELYNFIYDLVIVQIGSNGQIFFPIFFTLFLFLLILNYLGLTPFAFTTTSHIITTLNLALMLFISSIFIGFSKK